MSFPATRLSLRTFALLALGLAVSAGTASATTITWNNAAGGAWSNAANWTPSQVPDAAGEIAVLPALSGAYQVTLDLNPACDGLDIAAGDPTLDVNGQSLAGITMVTNDGAIVNFAGAYDSDRIRNQAGGTITVAGGITAIGRTLWNDGTIVLGTGTTMAADDDSLDLEGDGEIALDGQITIVRVLRIGSGIGIRGGGTITDWKTNNYGLIDANGGTFLHPRGIYNYGTLRIQNGAMLHVSEAFINNSGIIENGEGGGTLRIGQRDESLGSLHVLPGGRLIASEGDLTIMCGMLVEATLERSGEAGSFRIPVATVQNLTVAENAELVVLDHLAVMTQYSDLTNNGIIRVVGSVSFGLHNEGDGHALVGSGKIVLEGGRIGLGEGNAGPVVNRQLIEGCGTINAPFTNEGTINLDCSSEEGIVLAPVINRHIFRIQRGTVKLSGAATITNTGTIACDGGRITLQDGVTVDNRAGTLLSNRGMVDLGAVGGGTVWGGRLASNGDGLFGVGKTATLRDVTIGSSATVVSYGSTTLNLTGTRVVNEGTNRILKNATMAVSPTTEYLQTSGLTSLEKGRISSARDLRIEGGTLRGGGTIAGGVVVGGLLMPDPAMGALRIEGNYRQLSNATFHAMLGGTATTQNSRLDVVGTANLDGSLATSTLGSFHPASGSAFEVLSFAAVNGRFLQFREATSEAGLDVSPLYNANSFALQFRGLVSVDEHSRPAMLAFYGQRNRQGASFVLELPQSALLKGRVYDAAGREVGVLADGLREAGVHRFTVRGAGTSLASGVYFARMSVTNGGASEVKTARVTLLQ